MSKPNKHLLATFYSKIYEYPGGCHIWTGAKSGTGYGYIRTNNKTRYIIRTHIFAFILEHKRLPKYGYDIHHKCHNKSCCNPAHLEELSCSEHMKRRYDRTPDYIGL